jgi:hypothetical protein
LAAVAAAEAVVVEVGAVEAPRQAAVDAVLRTQRRNSERLE